MTEIWVNDLDTPLPLGSGIEFLGYIKHKLLFNTEAVLAESKKR